MSSETAISMIETVKNKLNKYRTLKQNDKVKEYLNKLLNTSITPSLLQETKIDDLISQLASNTQASYCNVARNLLEKWQNKKAIPKSQKVQKHQSLTNIKPSIVEGELARKRKSIEHHTTNSTQLRHNIQSEVTSGPVTKKPKVLSFAEYVCSKKSMSQPSSSTDSHENKLTETEIKEIYAQFHANGEELVASVPDLAINVDKKLKQNDNPISHRHDVTNHSQHVITAPTSEVAKPKYNDIWAEDDDDDDDSEPFDNRTIQQQAIPKQIQPFDQKQINTKSNDHSQPSKLPSSNSIKKIEDNSMTASNIAHASYSRSSSNSGRTNSKSKPSESISFIRSRHGRQAVYSGSRVYRKQHGSLQELCVEVLKEHVDDICHSHFYRLPYELVKPILDVATPEQLYSILDNNPDYFDDCQPYWQQFCELHYKGAERQESENYFELYWRKVEEQETRLLRLTEAAKLKSSEKNVTTRQTKPLNTYEVTRKIGVSSTKTVRSVTGLPPTKLQRGYVKAKKPPLPPLLKKTLKAFNGKN